MSLPLCVFPWGQAENQDSLSSQAMGQLGRENAAPNLHHARCADSEPAFPGYIREEKKCFPHIIEA